MGKIYEVHKYKSLKENLQKVLPEMFDDFFELAGSVASYPMRKKQLHEMRKRGKPLRYAMEIGEYCFGEELTKLLEEVKHVLDLMGDIHDADVMIPELNSHIREMVSFNLTLKDSNRKIPTASLKDSIAKLRASRGEMFRELSEKLNGWGNGVFKSKIISSTIPNFS